MMVDSAQELLERLADGDDGAAAEAFRIYEPYLRMVVRRQLSLALRAKFDSMDIVQSVWAHLLTGFRQGRWHFETPEHLRAFLVKVVRNRFLSHARHATGALKHEKPVCEYALAALPALSQDRPSDLAMAEDLWERILALCSAEHRPIVELRRQGVCLDEIAERLQYHKSSVRRILYDLARRLACAKQTAGRPTLPPEISGAAADDALCT